MSKTKLLLNVVSNLRLLADSVQVVAEAMAGDESAEKSQPETVTHFREENPAVKVVTLEEVRAVLAEKSYNGFTTEVRALLQKHCASKLSEIDPSKYAALLADAKGLK